MPTHVLNGQVEAGEVIESLDWGSVSPAFEGFTCQGHVMTHGAEGLMAGPSESSLQSHHICHCFFGGPTTADATRARIQ